MDGNRLEKLRAWILARTHPLVYRLGLNPADAEDIAQEVLLKYILAAPDTFENRKALEAWVRRTLFSVAIDWLRRSSRAKRSSSREQPLTSELVAQALLSDPNPTPGRLAQQSEEAKLVWAAVGELTPRQHEAIRECYLYGETPEEAASSLKCSASNVRDLLERGLAVLAKKLVFLKPE
jgi:RNA polymerase sigma factor (sigma-70 family)